MVLVLGRGPRGISGTPRIKEMNFRGLLFMHDRGFA